MNPKKSTTIPIWENTVSKRRKHTRLTVDALAPIRHRTTCGSPSPNAPLPSDLNQDFSLSHDLPRTGSTKVEVLGDSMASTTPLTRKCCEAPNLYDESGSICCYSCGDGLSGTPRWFKRQISHSRYPSSLYMGALSRFDGTKLWTPASSSAGQDVSIEDDVATRIRAVRSAVLPSRITTRPTKQLESLHAHNSLSGQREQPIVVLGPAKSQNVESAPQSTHICYICGKEGHYSAQDCTFLSAKVRSAKFHRFMELAPELRERIYDFALASERPILPHLCDRTLKFHDDNQQQHDATNRLLGITKVSKKVRNEALPMFYSANTFQVGSDTVTYFDRLEHLGRFHLIRHVRFDIPMRREMRAGGILRGMNQYIKEADAYEAEFLSGLRTKERVKHKSAAAGKWLTLAEIDDESRSILRTHAPTEAGQPSTRTCSYLIGSSFQSLIDHPQYCAGGIEELKMFIALRKLTSTFTPLASSSSSPSSAPTFTSKLVLPIPRADIFTQYDSLKWFPTVCYGLGIHLHLVENIPLDYAGQGLISITWHQKYQKKDFGSTGSSSSTNFTSSAAAAVHDDSAQTEVYTRALELFPSLESMARPTCNTYHRSNCKRDAIRWYSMPTEGGGVFR